MEKVKVNNQIVHMRKYVKQAKVHVINKLVKQVKLLQCRKGTEAQVVKAKRKAERFLEEIALLKKIKPDDISKLALSKAKDWKNVLQNKNCTVHDRCVAMLANYAAVQKEVEVFHNANKVLVSKIADLIKSWEEKNKYSKNSPKSKKMSNTKETGKSIEREVKKENFANNMEFDVSIKTKSSKNVEMLQKSESYSKKEKLKEKNEDEICADVEVLGNIETKLSGQELHNNNNNTDEDVENTPEVKKSDNDLVYNTLENDKPNSDIDLQDNIIKITNEKDLVEDLIESENSNSDENVEESMEIEKLDNDDELLNYDNRESTKETGTPRNEDSVISKSQKFDEVKILSMDGSNKKKLKTVAFLNLDDLQGLDEIPESSASENDETDDEKTSDTETNCDLQNKINDPFFLRCGSNDSEEKLVDSSKVNNYPGNKTSFFSDKSMNSFPRQDNSDNWFHHKKEFQKFPNSHKKGFIKFKSERDNFKPFKNKFTSNNYDKFDKRSKSTFERKRSNYQTGFQMKSEKYAQKGKNKQNSEGMYCRNGGSNFIKNELPHKKDDASSKPLHPSWEAKRKQKNTSFQGKRVVFDD